MAKKVWIFSLVLLILAGCASAYGEDTVTKKPESEASEELTEKAAAEDRNPVPETEKAEEGRETEGQDGDYVTEGTENYRDFVVDSVLHSREFGDIHYCVFIPDEYDGSRACSLYVTLPGYQGLYFQGAAMNIRTEEFGFEAQNYREDMIILAPQLEDWAETSARKTIALTEYFLEHYKIDREQVYISGYSGGGETLSLVLESRPELYTAALICSSQWDGGYRAVTEAKTPVYFVTGESDEYYGSEPLERAYREIRSLYEAEGLSEAEIRNLVVLDIKPGAYFTEKGVTNQHGSGAGLFGRDREIMGWLFGKHEPKDRKEG